MAKLAPTRRGLVAALIAAGVPKELGAAEIAAWVSLVRQLRKAEGDWAAALATLNQADIRYLALSKRQRRGEGPDWYVAAQQAEARVSHVVEGLFLQIARARAPDRAGLAIKVGLLAAAYGIDPDGGGNAGRESDDLVAQLIRSLLVDVT